MDKTKEALLLYQLDNKILPNFNIPKLYTISHYPEIIRVFSALIGTTIKYSKRVHIPQKNFYQKLNKYKGHKEQMIYLNTELINTIIMQKMEL